MKLTIDIPDNQVTRVVEAFAATYGYQNKIETYNNGELTLLDNPQSKGQFFKEQIIDHIKRIVSAYELDRERKKIVLESLSIE